MSVPVALMFAGGILKAGSQISEGKSRSSALRSMADQIMEAGRIDASDFERQSSAQASEGRNIRSASGVQLNTGTALIVDENIVREIAIGKSRILEDARRRAAVAKAEARSARKSGILGAAGTILSVGVSAFG